MGFLVEDLIESVKDRSFAPISQSTFQDSDILRILNEELLLSLVSAVIKAREDFFLARKTRQLVAGKDHYLLPERALGNSIKAVFWVDSGGNKRLLQRRDIDRIHEYGQGNNDSTEFYFEGDEIVLMHPASSNSDSLLFIYARKPNELMLTSGCAGITGISTVGGSTTFTVDTDLTGSLSSGDEIDFLRGKSPYTLWSEEVVIISITSSTIEVPTTSIYDVDGSTVEPEVGDYICPTGYANIAMIPEVFHPVLAQMGACRLLSALGDQAKWQAAEAVKGRMLQDALALIRNRAESSPERPSRKNGLIKQFRSW